MAIRSDKNPRFVKVLFRAAFFAAPFFAMLACASSLASTVAGAPAPAALNPAIRPAPVVAPFIPTNQVLTERQRQLIARERRLAAERQLAPGAVQSYVPPHVAAQIKQAKQTAESSAKVNSAVQKIEKQRKFLLLSSIASGVVGGYLLKTQCCPSSAPCSVPDEDAFLGTSDHGYLN